METGSAARLACAPQPESRKVVTRVISLDTALLNRLTGELSRCDGNGVLPLSQALRRRTRRLATVAALALSGIVASASLGGAVAEFPGYPGLPHEPQRAADLGRKPGQWFAIAQAGMSRASGLEQGIRLPLGAATSYTQSSVSIYDGLPDIPNISHAEVQWSNVHLISPEGAADPYGHLVTLSVRSVAFGSVPVEATLQISQRFDDDGLPLPFSLETTNYRFRPWGEVNLSPMLYADSHILEDVTLKVTALSVDGVDLNLAAPCTTEAPAQLSVDGEGFWQGREPTDEMMAAYPRPRYAGAADVDYDRQFQAVAGGYLQGTVKVPRFAPCLTANGEDISPLLTATASGDDNPVELRVTPGICFTPLAQPPYPGLTSYEDVFKDKERGNCITNVNQPEPEEFPYPERPSE